MGGGGTNTTQKSDPWAGQQGYLLQGFDQASNYLNNPAPSYYPNSTVSAQSGYTQAAIDQTAAAADSQPVRNAVNVAGSIAQNGGLNGAGQNALTATANGDYLRAGNPYLQATVQNAIAAARPGIESSFAASGRLGSGAHAAAMADSADRTAMNAYMANYGQERGLQQQAASTLNGQGLQNAGLQLQAAGQIPGLAAAPSQLLGTAGAAQDQYQQGVLNSNIDRWNYNQNARLQQLQNYVGLIQGNYGGQTSTVGRGNAGMQALGGGIGLLGGIGQVGQGAGGLRSLGSWLGMGGNGANAASAGMDAYGGMDMASG
jgi:hypothetical protein